MGQGRLRRFWIRRKIRAGHCLKGKPRRETGSSHPSVPPAVVTLGAALLVAAGAIAWFQIKLRPIVAQAAQAQIQNTVVTLVDQAVAQSLARGGTAYGDLVTIQRDGEGTITSLTTDSGAMNQLRLTLVSDVLDALDGVDVSQLRIPLGSLLDSELVWARGPAITARALWVGSVSAEFESEFTSAGVNQTAHRIWLELSVPVTVLLPGESLELPVSTRICIAETVIVGQVPQLYTWPAGPASG